MTAGPRESARVTGSPGWKQEVRHFSPGSSGFVEGHAGRRSRCGDCCLRGGEGATGCSAFRASSTEDKPVPGPLAGAAGPGTPTASHVTTPGTGPSCFSHGAGRQAAGGGVKTQSGQGGPGVQGAAMSRLQEGKDGGGHPRKTRRRDRWAGPPGAGGNRAPPRSAGSLLAAPGPPALDLPVVTLARAGVYFLRSKTSNQEGVDGKAPRGTLTVTGNRERLSLYKGLK